MKGVQILKPGLKPRRGMRVIGGSPTITTVTEAFDGMELLVWAAQHGHRATHPHKLP
jgi:hypothetical protein